MYRKIKSAIFLLSAVLLFDACSNTQQIQKSSLSLKKEQELKLEAMKSIQIVGGTFEKTLNQKVKEGGLKSAADFCSTNAVELEERVARVLDEGIKVKRVTNKPRNMKNSANKDQLEVLDEINSRLLNGEKIDMLVKQKATNHYQVYKPIIMSAKCLNCHGTNKSRNLEAYNIILKKYPNDKAINYNLGDLRGVFLVDIIK